jgi:integrase
MDTPFSLRVTIDDGMRTFRENYWNHLPFGKKSDSICRKILDFFKGHYLDTISKGDVERMRRFFKEMGYSDSYVNKIHMTLSRLFSWWEQTRDGKFLNGTDVSRVVLPSKNPAGQVPRVKEKPRDTLITKEMKDHLCHVAEKVMGDIDLMEQLDFLWWSGLRQGDMYRITAANVNLSKGTIIGTQNKLITTRNPSGLPYKLTIPASRIVLIKKRIEDTPSGKPIFKNVNMQKRWNALRDLSKMPHIQRRDFRGAGTSALLDMNTDYETIRKSRGWKDHTMVAWYDKRGDDAQLKATEKLVEV